MPKTEQNVMTILREKCEGGLVSFRDYIDIALYAEGCGYYQREKQRVGRSKDRDFYTAESLGTVFARLVLGAAEHLLGKETAARSTFIEIVAEPGQGLIDQTENHPFSDSKVIRLGESIQAEGPVVLFANEWLDALPFHRLVFKGGAWQERGVVFNGETLEETFLKHPTPAAQIAIKELPHEIEEGYQLDLPLEAEAVLAELLQQDWTGLLLLFDYGKTREALLQDCPNGTARTYFRHQPGNDLLDQPGEKDITCDVCWTPLEKLLQTAGLNSVTLESQESFLVKRASEAAEKIVAGSAGNFSPDRQTLMELIHPANMGQRFQVLWGRRETPS